MCREWPTTTTLRKGAYTSFTTLHEKSILDPYISTLVAFRLREKTLSRANPLNQCPCRHFWLATTAQLHKSLVATREQSTFHVSLRSLFFFMINILKLSSHMCKKIRVWISDKLLHFLVNITTDYDRVLQISKLPSSLSFFQLIFYTLKEIEIFKSLNIQILISFGNLSNFSTPQ